MILSRKVLSGFARMIKIPETELPNSATYYIKRRMNLKSERMMAEGICLNSRMFC